MVLWMRVRRTWVLAGSLALFCLVLQFGGHKQILVPTVIGGGGSAVVWASFLPLGWAVAICLAYEGLGAQAEDRPKRRLVVFDSLLFVCATALLLLVLAVAGPHQDARAHLVTHALILSGLAAAVTARVNANSGIMAATVLLLVTSSYSPYLAAAEYIRILQPEGNLRLSFTLGVILFAAATWLMARRDRRRFGDIEEP